MNLAITPECTVGRIAAADPRTIPVFERLGLDYCCGGRAALADAARTIGLDPEAVLRDLRAACADDAGPDDRDWTKATLAELADHIEGAHHAFVRDALSRLNAIVPKVVRAHGERHPELKDLQDVIRTFSEEMHDHMIREERVVFPWIKRLERSSQIHKGPPWSVKRPISCMVHDHDDAGRALESMRRLTHGYTPPPDACPTYRSMLTTLAQLESDTHLHIHKENNILFPGGIAAEERLAVGEARPSCGITDR
jgi:regulator of cell morphogenesis and NO signaling